jgi:flagellar basal-body rod protein FlgF
MDRLVYIAMSSAQQDRLMESSLANNLANASTVGYKADQVNFKSLYVQGSAFAPTRIYSAAGANGVNLSEGNIDTTRRPLDIALKGNAWLSVTTPDGATGYVHSASLLVNSNGVLVTQSGDTVNSVNGFSITVPPGGPVSIDKTGGINVLRNGSVSVVDKLKIVSLPKNSIFKGSNGLIQSNPAVGVPTLNDGPVVLSGALEGSNVSAVETLVRMMDLSRQYEAKINQISTAKKDDNSVNQLLDVR